VSRMYAIAIISSSFLFSATLAAGEPSITQALRGDGKVVALDSAVDPKSGKEVKRVWIQDGKKLWLCYALAPKESYCQRQQ
jgi:hypothetical protein